MKTTKLFTVLATAALAAAMTFTTVDAQPPQRGEAREGWGQRGEGGQRPQRGEGAQRGQWGQRGETAPEAPGAPQAAAPGAPAPQQAADPIARLSQPFMRPFWQNQRVTQTLQLTEEQIAALSASHETATAAIAAAEAELAAAHEALRAAVETQPPDLEAVIAASNAVAEKHTAKQNATLTHVVAVKSTLTAAQVQGLLSMRTEAAAAGAPGAPGTPGGMTAETRAQIRELIAGGAGSDAVRAFLEERGITGPQADAILNNINRMREGGAGRMINSGNTME